jgi:AraC-like DNA-binding protein
MLEAARRNMDASDVIRVFDEAIGTTIFQTITKEDITAKGKIVPMGARHFAERAQRLQNLQQLWQIKSADPSVAAHMSGKEFARILAEELGEKNLFSENISVYENYETQKTAQEVQLIANEENMIAAEQGI